MRARLDLLATVLLALAALAVGLSQDPQWLRIAALTPLVLVLPGYAVLRALTAPDGMPAAERAIYAVTLSLGIAVLSGLVVQLSFRLERTSWTITLATVTLAAAAVGAGRSDARSVRSATPAPVVAEPVSTIPTARSAGFSRLAAAFAIALSVSAISISAWAISISNAGARREQARSHYTELALIPAKTPTRGGRAVDVLVSNHEGSTLSYTLRITKGANVLLRRRLRLSNGVHWHLRLAVGPISIADPVGVTLLKHGRAYRRAFLSGVPSL
jgi:uncharacterized membrane protein